MSYIEPQKFNLDELIKAKYQSVYDIWYDASAPNKNIDAAIKHTIIETFREAAEEHQKRRPQNIIFRLGFALVPLTVIAELIGPIAGLYQMSTQEITAPLGIAGITMFWAHMAGANSTKTIFHQQLKDAEFGYPINPNARGDRKVYEKAVKKIEKFIATKRPDGIARKPAADALRQ